MFIFVGACRALAFYPDMPKGSAVRPSVLVMSPIPPPPPPSYVAAGMLVLFGALLLLRPVLCAHALRQLGRAGSERLGVPDGPVR